MKTSVYYFVWLISIIHPLDLIAVVDGNLVSDRYNVQYLDKPNHEYHCRLAPRAGPHLEIYCFNGKDKSLLYMWTTVMLACSLSPKDYEYFEGHTAEDVVTEFTVQHTAWKMDLLTSYSGKQPVIHLSPFNTSCVGIYSTRDYTVELKVTRIDFWRVAMFLSGLILFFWAPKLGGNTVFFYVCGVMLGICSSLLILVFLISKMIPRGPVMYGFVLGGWTLGVCVLQLIYDNLRVIAVDYRREVGTYVAAVGLVSFIVCYRMGPVSDPRSKNLIQWALQGAALILIYFSSELHEAIVALLGLVFAVRLFGYRLQRIVRSFWYRRFPPTRRFLTNMEYTTETSVATTSALEDLRAYCSSPETNAWNYVRKISSPARFAEFIESGDHLTADEIHLYNSLDEEDVSDDESN